MKIRKLFRWFSVQKIFDALHALREKTASGLRQVFCRPIPTFWVPPKTPKRKRSYLPIVEGLETRTVPTTVAFDAASYTVGEGDGHALLTVQLNATSASTITVDYSTTGGSATGGGTDFSNASGTLTFQPGDLTKTISVTITDDSIYEGNENFSASLSNVNGASYGTNSNVTITITDNDSPPTVSFASSSSSGSESTTSVSLTVNLSAASSMTVTVPFSVSGTATAFSDYTYSSPLTISPGQTSVNLTFAVVNDSLDEDDETVIISFGTPTNATLGSITQHTYTILDNDPSPTVSLSSSTQTFTEAGGSQTVTVSLSTTSGRTVTVDYATSDITAAAGSDYTDTHGTRLGSFMSAWVKPSSTLGTFSL